MREYAAIYSTFWTGSTGKKIRAFGMETQLLALYLLSNPHANMFGLYYLPLMLISHETAVPEKKINGALDNLISAGFCDYDRGSEFVFVFEMASFQIGEIQAQDNRLKAVKRAWDASPSNPFRRAFWERYGQKYDLSKQGLVEGLVSPSKPSDIQEQEQEQEYSVIAEQRDTVPPASKKDPKTSKPKADAPNTPQAEAVEYFESAYVELTNGQPFKSSTKDFVSMARLIKNFGADTVREKIDQLAFFCLQGNSWFAKSAADFTIGTLETHWNSLIEPAVVQSQKIPWQALGPEVPHVGH